MIRGKKIRKCERYYGRLWDWIKYWMPFSVHFNSDQLISACASALKEELSIPSIKLRYEKGEASISKAGIVIREKEKNYEQHIDGHFAVPDICYCYLLMSRK